MAANGVTIVIDAIDRASGKINSITRSLGSLALGGGALAALQVGMRFVSESMGAAAKYSAELETHLNDLTSDEREALILAREFEKTSGGISGWWNGIKISVGQTFEQMAVGVDIAEEVSRRMQQEGIQQFTGRGVANPEYAKHAAEIRQVVEAERRLAAETDLATDALAQQNATLEGMSWDKVFSNVMDAQKAFSDFTSAVDDYHAALKKLADDKAAGKITGTEYTQGVEAATKAFEEGKSAAELWAKQFIVSTAQAFLAADGLSRADFSSIVALSESLGLIDPGVAVTMERVMSALSGGDIEAAKEAANSLEALFKHDGETLDINFSVPDATTIAGATAITEADHPAITDASKITPENADSMERIVDAVNKADSSRLLEALNKLKEIFGYDGKTATVTVNYVETGAVPSP